MSARYTPIPNQRSAQDADREMEEAFDLEHDDDEEHEARGAHESTPLTKNVSSSTATTAASHDSSSHQETTALSGAGGYDFEREYDFPPPGSPPPPSSTALPNDIGNSNGFVSTAPISIPKPRRSFFQRVAGAILPTHYQSVPTESHSTRPTGGGIENDGVFANVTAKPQAARTIRSANGEVHIVPEDNQKESPPTYLEAQADAVPPYWETTIHAPAGLEGNSLIIDDLPTGSFLIFCLNIFISFFFQFVGFLLTYLLHTSHAAKFGSRAGLGLTLIQLGWYSNSGFADEVDPNDDASATPAAAAPSWEGAGPIIPASGMSEAPTNSTYKLTPPSSKDWLAFLFMTLGWFLLLSSVIGYWRVKRWETSVRTAAVPTTPTVAQVQRDRTVRRQLEEVFGVSFADPSEGPRGEAEGEYFTRDESGNLVRITPHEAQLHENLRASGFI